jgi:hypothetical protein
VILEFAVRELPERRRHALRGELESALAFDLGVRATAELGFFDRELVAQRRPAAAPEQIPHAERRDDGAAGGEQ